MTWAAWRALETSWRLIAGVAGVAWQGLDRGGIEATLNLMGIRGRKKRRRVFEGLMEMERLGAVVRLTVPRGSSPRMRGTLCRP